MDCQNPYTTLSDVYAYGVVLYELTSGQLPYRRYNNRDQILFMVGRGKLKPDLKEVRSDVPLPLKRLVSDCISFKNDCRPPFSQVNHLSIVQLNNNHIVSYIRFIATSTQCGVHCQNCKDAVPNPAFQDLIYKGLMISIVMTI